MDEDPKGPQHSRENMLALALVAVVGGMILFFLYLVSFGIVGTVLMGAGLIAVIGVVHYLLWGRAFSEEVAAEREALRRHDARSPAKTPKVAPGAIQDLGRTQGIQEK
jgi:hypothetical protein